MKMAFVMVRDVDVTNSYPPLGILGIATYLDECGHETIVLDVLPHDPDYVENLADFKPDVIGFSMQTPQYQITESSINALQNDSRFAGVKFCVGGIHCTALKERTLREFNGGTLDFIVVGEGEEACLELLNNYLNYDSIPGIAFIDKSGKYVENPIGPTVQDLDKYPIANRAKLDFTKYLQPPGMIRGRAISKITPIITSRGCPWICNFCCADLMFTRKVRQRSVDNVMEEINTLINDYGVEGVMILDDVFVLDKKWVSEFCKRIRNLPRKFIWGCASRVDTLKEETIVELKKSGCVQIEFGVESGSDKILKGINKKSTQKKILKVFELCRKYGMKTGASFQVGHPYETIDDVKETEKVARAIKADYTVFFYSTPFPGCDFYQLAIDNEWFIDDGDFNNKWTIRQTEYPIVEVGLTKEEAKYWRNRLQNMVLFRNYFKLHNLKFAFQVGLNLLFDYKTLYRAMKKMIENKRIDDFLEEALNSFQVNKKFRI